MGSIPRDASSPQAENNSSNSTVSSCFQFDSSHLDSPHLNLRGDVRPNPIQASKQASKDGSTLATVQVIVGPIPSHLQNMSHGPSQSRTREAVTTRRSTWQLTKRTGESRHCDNAVQGDGLPGMGKQGRQVGGCVRASANETTKAGLDGMVWHGMA